MATRRRKGHSSSTSTDSSNQSSTVTSAPKKRRNRVFGQMTKRRWLVVWAFLIGMMYLFTLGADIHSNHLQNKHWIQTNLYDLSTSHVEGDLELAESLFGSTYFMARFLNQVAGKFIHPQSPTPFATASLSQQHTSQFYFSDSGTGQIFSDDRAWSLSGTLKVISDNLSGVKIPSKRGKKDHRFGPGGIVARPGTDGRQLYVAQPARQRIILYDTRTKQSTEIVKSYQSQPLNGPWGLRITRENGLCFTDQSKYGLSSKQRKDKDKKEEFAPMGVYCMKLVKDWNDQFGVDVNSLQLLIEVDSNLGDPMDFLFLKPSSSNSKSDSSNDNNESSLNRMVIAQCKESQFNLAKYVADSDGRFSDERVEFFDEELFNMSEEDSSLSFAKSKFSRADGLPGCSSGLAPSRIKSDSFLAVMPGGRLAYIDLEDGNIKFIIKAQDKVVFDDMNWVGSKLLITAKTSLWSLQLSRDISKPYHQYIRN